MKFFFFCAKTSMSFLIDSVTVPISSDKRAKFFSNSMLKLLVFKASLEIMLSRKVACDEVKEDDGIDDIWSCGSNLRLGCSLHPEL